MGKYQGERSHQEEISRGIDNKPTTPQEKDTPSDRGPERKRSQETDVSVAREIEGRDRERKNPSRELYLNAKRSNLKTKKHKSKKLRWHESQEEILETENQETGN